MQTFQNIPYWLYKYFFNRFKEIIFKDLSFLVKLLL